MTTELSQAHIWKILLLIFVSLFLFLYYGLSIKLFLLHAIFCWPVFGFFCSLFKFLNKYIQEVIGIVKDSNENQLWPKLIGFDILPLLQKREKYCSFYNVFFAP